MCPKEVCQVNIGELQDKNCGPVPLSWFNKGTKAVETLYAGTTCGCLQPTIANVRALFLTLL